jgi:hypothetical protein
MEKTIIYMIRMNISKAKISKKVINAIKKRNFGLFLSLIGLSSFFSSIPIAISSIGFGGGLLLP